MDFLPNEKTVEYANVILKNIESSDILFNEKKGQMDNVYNKIADLKKSVEIYQYYVLNKRVHKFDRNVLVQLKCLSTIINNLQQNDQVPSDEIMQIYKELIELSDDIENKFCKLKNIPASRLLFVKSKILFPKLFPVFSDTDAVKNKLVDRVFQFVKFHIEYLEDMAIAIINHIDSVQFDIETYSTEYFQEFLSIDLQEPEN
jgi:hypothetical protein